MKNIRDDLRYVEDPAMIYNNLMADRAAESGNPVERTVTSSVQIGEGAHAKVRRVSYSDGSSRILKTAREPAYASIVQREYQNMRRLQESPDPVPHVPKAEKMTVYEDGFMMEDWGKGDNLLVMSAPEGKRQGVWNQVSPQYKMQVLGCVFEAWKAAWDKGIAYNDMKMDNIVLFPQADGSIRVGLIDWGNSEDVSRESPEDKAAAFNREMGQMKEMLTGFFGDPDLVPPRLKRLYEDPSLKSRDPKTVCRMVDEALRMPPDYGEGFGTRLSLGTISADELWLSIAPAEFRTRGILYSSDNPAQAVRELYSIMFAGITLREGQLQQAQDLMSDARVRLNIYHDTWAETREGLAASPFFLERVAEIAQQSPNRAAVKIFQVMLQRDPQPGKSADRALLAIAGRELAGSSAGKKPSADAVLKAIETYKRSDEYQSLQVIDLYDELLGRAPDDSGERTYLGKLAAGTAVGEIANEIKNSEEYRIRKIKELYKKVLDRPAGDEDLRDKLQRLQEGESIDDVYDELVLSREYREREPEWYVNILYGRLTGVLLFSESRNRMFEHIADGTSSLTEVRYQLAHSENFYANMERVMRDDPRRAITLLYIAYLDRLPDPGGQDNYLNQLRAGRSIREIAAEIGGSQEARETAIRQLYPELLDREVDDSGFAHYPQELQRRPLTDIANEIRRNDGGWRRKYPTAPEVLTPEVVATEAQAREWAETIFASGRFGCTNHAADIGYWHDADGRIAANLPQVADKMLGYKWAYAFNELSVNPGNPSLAGKVDSNYLFVGGHYHADSELGRALGMPGDFSEMIYCVTPRKLDPHANRYRTMVRVPIYLPDEQMRRLEAEVRGNPNLIDEIHRELSYGFKASFYDLDVSRDPRVPADNLMIVDIAKLPPRPDTQAVTRLLQKGGGDKIAYHYPPGES